MEPRKTETQSPWGDWIPTNKLTQQAPPCPYGTAVTNTKGAPKVRYMNDYDIARAQRTFADHPVLGPAIETLGNLVVWTNCNSDGWAYWPKPCRAAAKLMELIERDGTWEFSQGPREDATEAEYKAALRPVKSFRTRFDADFEIVEIA